MEPLAALATTPEQDRAAVDRAIKDRNILTQKLVAHINGFQRNLNVNGTIFKMRHLAAESIYQGMPDHFKSLEDMLDEIHEDITKIRMTISEFDAIGPLKTEDE